MRVAFSAQVPLQLMQNFCDDCEVGAMEAEQRFGKLFWIISLRYRSTWKQPNENKACEIPKLYFKSNHVKDVTYKHRIYNICWLVYHCSMIIWLYTIYMCVCVCECFILSIPFLHHPKQPNIFKATSLNKWIFKGRHPLLEGSWKDLRGLGMVPEKVAR